MKKHNKLKHNTKTEIPQSDLNRMLLKHLLIVQGVTKEQADKMLSDLDKRFRSSHIQG